MNKKNGFGKFLLGAGIGVGLGILFAPKSGKETREELKVKMEELLEKAKNMDKEDIKKNIEAKVKEIKEDLKKLDKETVLDNVMKQAKKIKKKCDELVEYAIEKGTPVVEAAAVEVRTSTIKTLDAITAKLKEADNKKIETKTTAKKSTKSSKSSK